MGGSITVLRGLPGVGKSTTAALLRERLRPSIRVSNDDIRYLAKPRDFTQFSLEASETASVELAACYAERGFEAIVDGVFADTQALAALQISLARRRLRLDVVSLVIDVDDLLARNRSRHELARMPEDRLRALHQEFMPYGATLRVSGQLPEEIASDVLQSRAVQAEARPSLVGSLEVMFLRHGLPDFPEGRYPDHLLMPLSERGRAEARAARHAVERFDPEVVYTSDMLRAVETAAIAAPNVRPTTTEALRERTFPSLYGRTLGEIRETHPSEILAVLRGNSDRWEPSDAETLDEARERVRSFMTKLRLQHDFKRVLIVGHGGPHSWIVEDALGVDLTGSRAMRLDTGCFSLFRLGPSGTEIRYLNAVPEGAY